MPWSPYEGKRIKCSAAGQERLRPLGILQAGACTNPFQPRRPISGFRIGALGMWPPFPTDVERCCSTPTCSASRCPATGSSRTGTAWSLRCGPFGGRKLVLQPFQFAQNCCNASLLFRTERQLSPSRQGPSARPTRPGWPDRKPCATLRVRC